jgi:hypothetical protein
VVLVAVFALNPSTPAPQPMVVNPGPPPVGPVGPPGGKAALEPGTECTISNLRTSNALLTGFGGQPALAFDYVFPGGQGRTGPHILVAVVTVPRRRPVAATVTPLLDDRGTVSLAPVIGFATFPPGTTVYLGDQIDAGPDELPRRVSNVLMLE